MSASGSDVVATGAAPSHHQELRRPLKPYPSLPVTPHLTRL